MLIRIICIMALLMVGGCASFQNEYTTRYGLANPDNPPVHPNPVDESYAGGTIGQRQIEEFDRKYHEKDVLAPAEVESSE